MELADFFIKYFYFTKGRDYVDKILFLAVIVFAICINSSAVVLDSRIVVIVLEDYDGEIIHNERMTVILNEKFLDMGFKPVLTRITP